ncbi:unnamed protein product, partial [Diamesa serratosioi]
VSHIHKKGIVHRDIKLENILLDKQTNRIKLADFGLSCIWDKSTYLKTNCGSPEYAAPELHFGKKYGAAVDIWSLGVVFFGMIVGRLPFEYDMKKNLSLEERKTYFSEVTKRSVKTVKHQNLLATSSFLFKNLLSKLLNPNQHTRIKIEEVELHAWIFGLYVEEMPDIDNNWKQGKFQKYANVLNTNSRQINDTISDNPFGQLAGIFNIEQHSYK